MNTQTTESNKTVSTKRLLSFMQDLVNSRIEANHALIKRHRKEIEESQKEIGELLSLFKEAKTILQGKRIPHRLNVSLMSDFLGIPERTINRFSAN
jgi:hypothetical protein